MTTQAVAKLETVPDAQHDQYPTNQEDSKLGTVPGAQ